MQICSSFYRPTNKLSDISKFNMAVGNTGPIMLWQWRPLLAFSFRIKPPTVSPDKTATLYTVRLRVSFRGYVSNILAELRPFNYNIFVSVLVIPSTIFIQLC